MRVLAATATVETRVVRRFAPARQGEEPPDWLIAVAPSHHAYLLREVIGDLELHCCENSDGTRDYWLEPFVGLEFLRFRGNDELAFSTGVAAQVIAHRYRQNGPRRRASIRF